MNLENLFLSAEIIKKNIVKYYRRQRLLYELNVSDRKFKQSDCNDHVYLPPL